MTSQQFCFAPHCRFPHTHVLASHRCSKCTLNGHSQPYCGKKYKSNNHSFVRVPSHLQCTTIGCHFPTFHTTEVHCCTLCGRRDGTHLNKCPITLPQFETNTFIEPDTYPSVGHYVSYYCGQGSQIYCRNNHGTYEYFFLHGDSYGQYGKDTCELPLVNAFILEYLPM